MEFSAICLTPYGQSPLKTKKIKNKNSHIYKLMRTMCMKLCLFLFTVLCIILVIVCMLKESDSQTNWFTVLTCLNQTSLRELTTLGIKNAENLAIPSVRNDVSIHFLPDLDYFLLRLLKCMISNYIICT